LIRNTPLGGLISPQKAHVAEKWHGFPVVGLICNEYLGNSRVKGEKAHEYLIYTHLVISRNPVSCI